MGRGNCENFVALGCNEFGRLHGGEYGRIGEDKEIDLNRVECLVDTPFHVSHQPQGKPTDIDLDDEALLSKMESTDCKATKHGAQYGTPSGQSAITVHLGANANMAQDGLQAAVAAVDSVRFHRFLPHLLLGIVYGRRLDLFKVRQVRKTNTIGRTNTWT
jgi:hypothetical protein